jgi:hypothetical protein
MNSDDTDPWSGGSRCFRSGRDGLGDADASSVAVAVAAVGILLVAVFAWPDQSELTADEPASSTPAVPTTLDILIYAVGTRFFDDAGDVYPVDPNGDSSRISSGDVLAIASPSLLLRECNANWVCNAVLRDYQGGQIRVVDLPPSFQPRFLAASLSPDDRAVALAGANLAGERTILNLNSGEILLFAGHGGQVSSPTWTADGAGIFALGSAAGIRFLDRVSGEEFSLAAGLGQIRAIATRSPAG